MGSEPDEIRQQIAETRDRMGERADALSYKADVKARVSDTVREKTSAVADFFGGRREQLPSSDEVRSQGRRAANLVRDNPISLAAGAAALGLLIGLVLPSTDVENERLGGAADAIKNRALEAGQEALDRGHKVVQDVAQSAVAAAKESGAEQAGLLQDSAQEKAQQATEQARDNLIDSNS